MLPSGPFIISIRGLRCNVAVASVLRRVAAYRGWYRCCSNGSISAGGASRNSILSCRRRWSRLFVSRCCVSRCQLPCAAPGFMLYGSRPRAQGLGLILYALGLRALGLRAASVLGVRLSPQMMRISMSSLFPTDVVS